MDMNGGIPCGRVEPLVRLGAGVALCRVPLRTGTSSPSAAARSAVGPWIAHGSGTARCVGHVATRSTALLLLEQSFSVLRIREKEK